MKLIGLIFLILMSHFQNISADTFAECDNLPNGAFIGGTKGCQSYIYCDGDDSYEGFCPSQLLFNTKDGSCAAAADVDCSDDDDVPPPPAPAATTTTTKATTTPVRTTTRASTTARTTRTTTSATTLAATSTSTAVDEPVEESVEEAMEVTEENEETEAPTAVEVTDEDQTSPSVGVTTSTTSPMETTSRPTILACPATDNPNEVIFLPSTVSCNEYFVCYHGTPVRMFCAGQLYFDYLSSKCELPERVNCLIGSLVTQSPKQQCTVNTFDYFPYPKNCNYFYKCINGYLSLQQCPIGFGWSDQMKLCVKLNQGQCPTRSVGFKQSNSVLYT